MKIMVVYTPVFTDQHCQYFNPKTKLCSVFEDRFKVGVGCLTTDQAIEIRALPNECPYVKDIKGYDGPISLYEKKKRLTGSGQETQLAENRSSKMPLSAMKKEDHDEEDFDGTGGGG